MKKRMSEKTKKCRFKKKDVVFLEQEVPEMGGESFPDADAKCKDSDEQCVVFDCQFANILGGKEYPF
ncbi:MAG: hypothetical protein V2A78_09685 [bacterium]